jgi:hypothetical protein
MTQGPPTGQSQGGNQDDDVLPGERPDHEMAEANPAEEPRAAQQPMSDQGPKVPDRPTRPGSDAKAPGITDATGPTG